MIKYIFEILLNIILKTVIQIRHKTVRIYHAETGSLYYKKRNTRQSRCYTTNPNEPGRWRQHMPHSRAVSVRIICCTTIIYINYISVSSWNCCLFLITAPSQRQQQTTTLRKKRKRYYCPRVSSVFIGDKTHNEVDIKNPSVSSFFFFHQ